MKLTVSNEQRLGLAGHYARLSSWGTPTAEHLYWLTELLDVFDLERLVDDEGAAVDVPSGAAEYELSEDAARFVLQTYPPAQTPRVLGRGKVALLRAIDDALTLKKQG